MNETHATKLAKLNDQFRALGFGYTITIGVQQLMDVYSLIEEVRTFGNFTEDNDPYGEHDFGSLEWEGQTVFWKIDYYDSQLKGWKDPLGPDCKRVLTIMLASEY